MLKEADVSKKGLLAFRECLSVVSSLTEELPAKDMPDYQAIVRGEGFKRIVYLEVNYHPLKQVVFWRHFYKNSGNSKKHERGGQFTCEADSK